MPVRIGYYDDGEFRAGTGRYLTEIIGALDRQRYQPVFFAPEPRSWHDDLKALNVEMVYLRAASPTPEAAPATSPAGHSAPASRPKRRWIPTPIAWTIGLLKELKRLRTLFRKSPVDLLHSNNTGAESAPIAARLAGIRRVVGTLHVLPSYDLDNSRSSLRFRMLEKRSMRALDVIIGCCEAACRDWQARCGFPAEKTITIHNGIDLTRIERTQSVCEARAKRGLPENAILIGAVGNLHRYKGYEHLVRAVPLLVNAHPDVRVLIAGTGPEEGHLRKLAAELQVDKQIDFLGFCSDVRTVLESLDIYVQASLVEAFPIAILEANGLGLPVVATAVGGVPEAILPDVNGLLVPPADPSALASALLRLAAHPEQRQAMGEAGRDRVRRLFGREQMLAKTLEVYDRLLK